MLAVEWPTYLARDTVAVTGQRTSDPPTVYDFIPRRDFTGRVNLGCVLRLVPDVSGLVTVVAGWRVRPGRRGRRLPPCRRGRPGGAGCRTAGWCRRSGRVRG